MSVLGVNIGTKRIWMTAYNPSDVISRAYCVFAVHHAVSRLSEVPLTEVHAWIREHLPKVPLDGNVPRDVPPNSYPVTPGEERFEVPIIAHLIRSK